MIFSLAIDGKRIRLNRKWLKWQDLYQILGGSLRHLKAMQMIDLLRVRARWLPNISTIWIREPNFGLEMEAWHP